MPAATYITPFIFTPALGIQTASLRMGFAASRGGSAMTAFGVLLVCADAKQMRLRTMTIERRIFQRPAIVVFIGLSGGPCYRASGEVARKRETPSEWPALSV